jgi:CarboxypepD_reg-like domain
MKTLFFILSLGSLTIPLNSFAFGDKDLKTSTIAGKIVDLTNQENLAGAEVLIVETGTKIFTDFDGNYNFDNLPIGNYTIKVNLISYKDSEVKIDTSKNTKITKQTIFLESRQ